MQCQAMEVFAEVTTHCDFVTKHDTAGWGVVGSLCREHVYHVLFCMYA